ncbi:LysR family transcriptional regulator [Paenibacillus macerans]|uniref:Bacterial regulatory helix-turn-helix, lysR family protein n=1 Tax=Paenibacillus macerans TaxID=44252 RepID=A0A090ZA31_PAEMA|nr:LysR family transcriptional regulator [Paenibacillus macerans]KFN07060.1 bacterial regulatory helix-turn-helix, lysR family protein [Paenibacillus macerans]MBS5910570.1 LysR family transcriptional regulator [Paenibacillus macerans]MCY7560624.1 LysR family transcriptional regulator [Paenibacillus macerans]MDU5949853.1 LysR family transcriptional regulator [Paenibacillus macerans]MEC0139749.1 LysR family transcriptional regulator [Paenibacillus macerans]
MELRQLITFRTVASTLNFTRAAEVLGYVPSNVTMQIKALEDELGVRLFDRLGKQLVLTAAGKRFLTHIQGVLNKLDEARSAVHDNEVLSGTLTISANEVICAYRLPAVFQRFRSQHPGVRLIFRSVPNQELKQTLFEGTADVVFMLDEPIRSSGLAVEPLVEETFRLFAAPDHPLAKRTELQLEDFHGEVFMTNEKGCPYRTMFDRSFEKEGIDSITYLEFQSAEAIKQCAISGIGIAFLPEIVAEAEAERGKLVALPWQIPDLHVYTQMSWHKDKWLSPIMLSFIAAAREVLAIEEGNKTV